MGPAIAARKVQRLFRQAGCDRWNLDLRAFASVLEASVEKKFGGQTPAESDLDRYLSSLHLADLALACACAAGNESAWDHFVRDHRRVLYRCADAIDPTGGARELADSLYADLYGISDRAGERRSLFRYFHGRSSLATWLRSVLSQRYVDRVRGARKLEEIPDDDALTTADSRDHPDPDRPRLVSLLQQCLAGAISRLSARDRLRLGCYYSQDLTLAQTGRLLREHEATVSRQLAGTRRRLREEVERELRDEGRLNDAQIAECFEWAARDPGTMDLQELLTSPGERKDMVSARSMKKRVE